MDQDIPVKQVKLLPAPHHHSHKLVVVSGVIVSFLVIILALYIANSRMSYFGRAATVSTSKIQGSLSAENSYLFASPISALADGASIIRITVIILNDQGLGVAGQQVTLKSTSGSPVIKPVSPSTDTFGRAIFDLSASVPANYTISAEVSGTILPQTVSVVFR